MVDRIQKFIKSYEKTFAKDVERRREELKLAEEVANLGAAVIAKGAKKLIKRAGLEFDDLEKSNKQLSKRIKDRVTKIDRKLSKMPDRVRSQRQHRLLMAQDISCRKKTEDPCLWSPAAIFTAPVRTCDGCTVEISHDVSLGRTYPVLTVTGSGTGGMRIGEVYSVYIWTFIPETSGAYAISANIEFSGRLVGTREYHCYADTSGSGYNYELGFGHSQEGSTSEFSILEGTLPTNGSLRVDGTRTANQTAFLEANQRAYVILTQRFTVSARSRYATQIVNFGSPASDNYIDVPWMCWSLF
jgi:hypothetical protein